jgi:hypothetical protein
LLCTNNTAQYFSIDKALIKKHHFIVIFIFNYLIPLTHPQKSTDLHSHYKACWLKYFTKFSRNRMIVCCLVCYIKKKRKSENFKYFCWGVLVFVTTQNKIQYLH